jgi:hypothetical protein
MLFKTSIKKKQLKLTLDCFIILNSNFFLLQINDYIKACSNSNILFNVSLTNLLFGKKKNRLSTEAPKVYKKSYNISFRSFSSESLMCRATKKSIFFKPFLESFLLKLNSQYYKYNLYFLHIFNSNNIIFS